MPFRAITSDRVCGIQPSERSPRTALHQDGIGDASHMRTVDDCAAAASLPRSVAAIASVVNDAVIACPACERFRSQDPFTISFLLVMFVPAHERRRRESTRGAWAR
jgi:hypothetical protein